MQEWKNPLFQTGGAGERSLSGGVAQSSTSGLSDSFCAPYRPSPVPLRTNGDVVASLGKVRYALLWISRTVSIYHSVPGNSQAL